MPDLTPQQPALYSTFIADIADTLSRHLISLLMGGPAHFIATIMKKLPVSRQDQATFFYNFFSGSVTLSGSGRFFRFPILR